MRNTPTAGIILAAGESSRFGQPKQLVELRGRMLVAWVLDAALASHLETVVLILGRDHHKISAALGQRVFHPKLELVFNPRYHEGQSTSLTAGLFRIRDRFPAVMFLLGPAPGGCSNYQPAAGEIPAFRQEHLRSRAPGATREPGAFQSPSLRGACATIGRQRCAGHHRRPPGPNSRSADRRSHAVPRH